MTNLIKREIPSIFPHSLFDNMFDERSDIFDRVGTTLPYNVKDYTDSDGNAIKTELEFALAGYTKDDISLKISGDDLLLEISPIGDEESNVVYRHKGISQKTVKLKFKLSGHADKENIKTKFIDGLLKIEIPIVRNESVLDIEIQ